MRHLVALGLPLLALVLLIGGCAAPTSDPCPAPCDPCYVPCVPCGPTPPSGEWPDVRCEDGTTPSGMLNQVSHLAIEAPGGYIDEGIRRAIVAQCDRCQEPDLADAQGVPVLMIEDLDYCARLRGLHDKATSTPDPEPPIQTGEILPPEEIEERKKAGSRRRWETIAQELESFPNAVPVTQD